MTQEVYGVHPGSDDYSHEVVISAKGKRVGLTLLDGIRSAHINPPPRQPPPVMLEQNSWHGGRGAEVWMPNGHNYYDALNCWTTTPNKLHPTLLMQWVTGFRDAEMNMPSPGDTHRWTPLINGSSVYTKRYRDVTFTASATSNRQHCIMIVRRKGRPGTLTMEWCSDSGGNPSTVLKTITKSIANAPDLISYYMDFIPSSVQAVTSGTTYHLKIYGAATDDINDCWEVLCDTSASGLRSSDGTTWTAATLTPYYRITDADTNQRIFFFEFDSAWYAVTSRENGANSQLFIHGCRGKATAGAATTLTDTGAGQYGGTWTTNMWANYKVRIVRGAGRGQVRTISSNTGTVLTVSEDWDTNPTTSSQYVIYGGSRWKEITGHGLGWVSAKPVYSNGIIYFPQDDTVDIRIMQLNYANANDHGFDAEDTKHNRAYFLAPTLDASLGPIMVRANVSNTSGGNPDGKASSVGKGPTSPNGTAIVFGTDIIFQTSILVGDSTHNITGLYVVKNKVWVAKEDKLFGLTGNVPVETAYGADSSPNILNGVAACEGADGQFYLAAQHDVFLISGNNSYPLNLPFNMPSTRSGYVMDMVSERGWLFAAVDAGSGWSSIMRMGLKDRTWHEQCRAPMSARRIRNLAWLNFTDTNPQLIFECKGDMIYQQMPQFGVRPVQDTSVSYQHEGVVEFATMDLLNNDPKFFSFFLCNVKKLADASNAAAYGREVALDYQLNNNVGETGLNAWIPAGAFGRSPQDKIEISKGSQQKIRPRLRIESDQANNPPIVENLGLSLFSRQKQYASVTLDINGSEGEEDASGEEIFSWLVECILTADIVNVRSVFSFLHNKRMILPAEPNVNITNLDPETGWGGVFQLYCEYLPE